VLTRSKTSDWRADSVNGETRPNAARCWTQLQPADLHRREGVVGAGPGAESTPSAADDGLEQVAGTRNRASSRISGAVARNVSGA